MLLSIITPTYNRAYCLSLLYESLLRNGNKDYFEWILIDDGSSDGTEKLVDSWLSDEKINLKYFKKENDGKTNALVDAFNLSLRGKFSVVIDSDDILVNNAITFLKKTTTNLASKYIGLVVLKSDLNDNIIGTKFIKEDSNYIDIYYGKNKSYGDRLFIVETETYRKSLIKSFENEKLIPESVFYINMSSFGIFKCFNYILYKGDYLEDGLSFDVLKLASKNIKGFIFEKQLLQKQKLSLVDRIKNDIKYISYSFSDNRSPVMIIKNSNNKIITSAALLPTFIFTLKRIIMVKKMRKNN